jgi:hypothetical protein
LLLALGYGKPPLFIGTPRLLRRNSYLWRIRVVIYEKSMTDHIHRIHQVVEASAPRWMFEGGMRDTAWEALVVLWHEEDDQIEHSQYRHFLSYAREGAKVVVIPTGDRDRIGCFADQVKLTHALVWDLDEAIKEIKLLGEHKDESSQKITVLEALCKRQREDAQKLRDEKTTLEGMVESHSELIMEMAEEYGLNRMGENDDEEEDDDDEGNAAAPPAPVPPAAATEVVAVNEEDPVEMVPEQEASEAHEVVLAEAEPELS